uniref:tRNA-t(6)A37 methylthiotransferase n=1 Tax=Caenorhabditis japonica TaxID=281687 RepID=A0A8R1I5M8_CAEJA
MDIEDFIGRTETINRESYDVKIRSKKITSKQEKCTNVDSFVPGAGQSVWVRTWGCSHNTSDSEYMSGLLAKAGYNVVGEGNDAEVWVLNSCTVKTPSEQQANNLVVQGQESGKKVIMAGCVSQAAPSEPWMKNLSIVGVKQIDRIVEVVGETLKGNNVRLLSRNRPDALLSLPKMRKNDLIEVLSISTGCLNNCTYCKTKMARGDLVSYPLAELVEQARAAFYDDGVKELWLTSEDLGAWGRDIGLTLPDLLKELVNVIPDGSMMRLGMTNPPYILDHLEEIAEILNHPKVYAFLHIPVQSASDAVLNDMKREYSRRHFEQIADYLIEKVPNIYIATDMILAFPTENEEDFQESMDLVRKYKFPSLFINQYYPRSGTPAARLKKIDTVEARRRTGAMSELFKSYSRYTSDRVGEVHNVIVTEIAADKLHAVGHNKCYEQILVPLEHCKMGEWIEVRVTSVTKFSMIAAPTSIVETVPEVSSPETTKFRFFYPMTVFFLVLILSYCIDKFISSGMLGNFGER